MTVCVKDNEKSGSNQSNVTPATQPLNDEARRVGEYERTLHTLLSQVKETLKQIQKQAK